MPVITRPISTSQKRSPFAVPIVLGLLSSGPRHGYALYACVQRELKDVWQVGMNRLYALLEEMESNGLIRGHAERAGLRPTRRVFRLTTTGKRVLDRWMNEPSLSMREMRVDFPPKLYFALRRGPRAVANLIKIQRQACESELARMLSRQGEADGVERQKTYRYLIYEFRIRQIHSILGWLDECEGELTSRTPISKS